MINVSWLFFIAIGWMFRLDDVFLQSSKVDVVIGVAVMIGFGLVLFNRKRVVDETK